MKESSTTVESGSSKNGTGSSSKEKPETDNYLKNSQDEINIWDELGDLAVGAIESVAAQSSPYDIEGPEDDENIDPHDIPLQSEECVANENSNILTEMNDVDDAQIELLVKEEEKSLIDNLIGSLSQENADREEGEVSDEAPSEKEHTSSARNKEPSKKEHTSSARNKEPSRKEHTSSARNKEAKDPDPKKSVEEYYIRLEKIYTEAKRMTQELHEGISELFKKQQHLEESKKQDVGQEKKKDVTRSTTSANKSNDVSRSRKRSRSPDRRSRGNRDHDSNRRPNVSTNRGSNNRIRSRDRFGRQTDRRSSKSRDFSRNRRDNRSRSRSTSYCTDCEREKRHSLDRDRKKQWSPKRNALRSPRPHPLLRTDDKNDLKTSRRPSNKTVDTKEKERAKTLVDRQMKMITDVIDNPKPKPKLPSNPILDMEKAIAPVEVNKFTTKKPKRNKPALEGLKDLDDMENFITLLKDRNKDTVMTEENVRKRLMQLKKKKIQSENISPVAPKKSKTSVKPSVPDPTLKKKQTEHGVRKSLFFQTTKPKPDIQDELTSSLSSSNDSCGEETKPKEKTSLLQPKKSEGTAKPLKEPEGVLKTDIQKKSLTKERAKGDADQKVRDWIKGQSSSKSSGRADLAKKRQTHVRIERKPCSETTSSNDSENEDKDETVIDGKHSRVKKRIRRVRHSEHRSTSASESDKNSKSDNVKTPQRRAKAKPKQVVFLRKDLKQLALSKELRQLLASQVLEDGMLLKVNSRKGGQNTPQFLKVVRVAKNDLTKQRKPLPKPKSPKKPPCTLQELVSFMEQLRKKRDAKSLDNPHDKMEVVDDTPRESRFLDRKRAKRKAKLMACLAVESKTSNKEARLLEAMRKTKSKEQLETEEVLKKFKAENEAVMMQLLKSAGDKCLPKDSRTSKESMPEASKKKARSKEFSLPPEGETMLIQESNEADVLTKELLSSSKAQSLLNSLRARKKRQKSSHDRQ